MTKSSLFSVLASSFVSLVLEKHFEELENGGEICRSMIRREEMGRQNIEIDFTNPPLLSAKYKIGSEELKQAFHDMIHREKKV
jgi:hypothetical protein